MASTAYNADAFKWARLFLTGNASSAVPDDPTLLFLLEDARETILLAYPCIAQDGDLSDELLAEPEYVSAFAKALGFQMAAFFVLTPAGNSYSGNIVSSEVESGENGAKVRRTRKEADPETAASYLRARLRDALLRFPCIKAHAVESASAAGFVSVTGRRRAIERKFPFCSRPTEYDLTRRCD